MKASVFYRIASILLLLFAISHTLFFHRSDPAWGIDALVSSMRSVHFKADGFNRTHWDFFLAAGFTVGDTQMRFLVIARGRQKRQLSAVGAPFHVLERPIALDIVANG